ncbi:phenylacetate-CoA ligase [Gelidibacter algens]|uniref:Phenylacetate-CoA ligase n=1 Tax=Gelidibacter algens TaxID=49280 RepID=A0A327RYQ0_9FLAO|nr:hypothetical protein [Gelidibacter algens]RAJ22046.1 phenylacetate-CoA ligase [Gelidibacter algens]
MAQILNIRQKIIWFLDTLKGSPVKDKLNYTSANLDAANSDVRHDDNEKNLKSLLNHAIATTAYYKAYTAVNSLEDFPVVNKNLIRDNLKDFTSNTFELTTCVKASTSGSTGVPFSIYQNKEKVNKNTADDIFFSSKSNYRIGSHLVYIKIWPDKFNFKQECSLKLRNIHPHDVFKLTNDTIDELITKLNKSKEAINFKGYVSAFEKICRHLDALPENPITFKTQSIITISESINLYTKNAVKKYFGVWPVSRYSNLENGVIAQQFQGDDPRFWINDSSYIIEIFDLNENRKLNYGQHGRIVLTDLYNLATPLIRYDTGDVGTMHLDTKNKPYFSELYGRKLDLIYDTKGNLVPPHITDKLCKYGDFKQYQLVQKGLKDYDINLNTTIKVDENSMIKEFKTYFGQDAHIKVNYVDGIPLLGSGKRREMVNEYYKTD